ncbi:ATP-binding protein [Actinosynnema sp. NPDC023587]|uniref:ATP-binding protein n=1 Tax=Actinosynnema sp. NPDC023587 TaxID=3154695 RepID=UPI0033CBF4F1
MNDDDDRRPVAGAEVRVLADGRDQLVEVRRWVERLLGDVVDPQAMGDVLLVVTELVSNAYDHGRRALEVRVVRPSWRTRRVRVEVDDTSSELPVLGRSRIADSRGMGLVLVNALSAAWGTLPRPGGKTVWADITAPAVAATG